MEAGDRHAAAATARKPETWPSRPTNPYALGWQVQDYRGHKLISHGGGVLGSITRVVLIPEKNVGFTIMMNSEDSGLLLGLTYRMIDHYLGLPDKWLDRQMGKLVPVAPRRRAPGAGRATSGQAAR